MIEHKKLRIVGHVSLIGNMKRIVNDLEIIK
jgi:hypothetical protein